jgi:hypothetical protein
MGMMELGFSRERVMRAFIACDRDADQAANLLIEQYEETGSLFQDANKASHSTANAEQKPLVEMQSITDNSR